MDFVGPFPDKGYIFIYRYTFTRWIELRTSDANNSQMFTTTFLWFGTPAQLQ
jgi:hypothetical protein